MALAASRSRGPGLHLPVTVEPRDGPLYRPFIGPLLPNPIVPDALIDAWRAYIRRPNFYRNAFVPREDR